MDSYYVWKERERKETVTNGRYHPLMEHMKTFHFIWSFMGNISINISSAPGTLAQTFLQLAMANNDLEWHSAFIWGLLVL